MRRRLAIAALLAGLAVPATGQERYIPLELIVGAPWDGTETLAYPAGSFAEKVRDPSVWIGPRDWQHPKTGRMHKVYDRSRGRDRRHVDQIFAVRADGVAIGRAADSRGGIEACEEEAKYPLGRWKQGEGRGFDYVCWYGGSRRMRRAVIEILRIDFDCGTLHCLEIRWTLSDPMNGRQLDNHRYTFAPGKGMVDLR